MRDRLAEAVAARDLAEIAQARAEDNSRGLQRDLTAALASQARAQADLERAAAESRAMQGELAEERERFIADRRTSDGVRDVLRADVARLQRRLAAAEAVVPSMRADRFERLLPPTEHVRGAAESEVHRSQLAAEEAEATGFPAGVLLARENGAIDPRNRSESSSMDTASDMPPQFGSGERVVFGNSAPDDPLDNTGRLETSRAAVIMAMISSCSPQPRFTRFACPKRW